ncbi:acylase [Kordiimonas aquimaris]|uniref:acylase n=1 Tax=Kordiimonas aquimaris TaxID=707591 RepID=UPI0021CDF003|nr:acylase [Kordiimonas aquimaris]
MKYLSVVFVLLLAACSQSDTESANTGGGDLARWQAQAENVTITRDKWGIPHVYGKTDADAVFGMLYAQAEDDFNRIEVNYLNAMGRLAEAEGESALYRDLRMKLFIDPGVMKAHYAASPEWLQKLMNAYADGLNYYLHTHPEVKPRVIKRFEPWMALTFSEGSIGGDIERVNLRDLEGFYGDEPVAALAETRFVIKEPTGSNGFAIAPSNSATGNALFLINPHTSFYFRAEMQVTSDEGLNAYGAVTWGQFFIYQGFNENAGWMHTSSGADAIDWYEESITRREDGVYYRYGDDERKMKATEITLPYKTEEGGSASKTVTAYHSHHGPIIAGEGDKWISIKLMNEPVKALSQSYLRTKAAGYDDFLETMRFHTNSSNNTVYADKGGNIAYFHGNFIPRRDTGFDWNKTVDGSNPATEWQGLHTVEETVGVLNPENGWLQNTNNTPYSVIGDASPKAEDFPPYMATFPENYRGINAVRVLKDKKDFTIDSLIAAAYDPHLAAFDVLLPKLFEDYDALSADDPRRAEYAEQITFLKAWDRGARVDSVATSLAIFWATDVVDVARADVTGFSDRYNRDAFIASVADDVSLEALGRAIKKLEADFGSWQVPWGQINRFQRITGDIVQPHSDAADSIPVGFASAFWGSLASFGVRETDTKRMYGSYGNSFVAAVEFGEKVRAKAVTAGGQSGDPASPHFKDQAGNYARGELRPVYFYPEDIAAVAERTYKPGE